MNILKRFVSWRDVTLVVMTALLTVFVIGHTSAMNSQSATNTTSKTSSNSGKVTPCSKFGELCKVVQTDEYGDSRVGFVTVDKPTLRDSYPFTGDILTKPKNNKQFVVFKFTVKAIDAGFTYNELSFFMRGPSGDNITTSGNEEVLADKRSDSDHKFASGTLQKDEVVSGLVDYDAPEHGTLVYDRSTFIFVPVGEAIGEWKY